MASIEELAAAREEGFRAGLAQAAAMTRQLAYERDQTEQDDMPVLSCHVLLRLALDLDKVEPANLQEKYPKGDWDPYHRSEPV